MLEITIPGIEGWDEKEQIFVDAVPAQTIELEHSLVSLRMWESKWCKAFHSKQEKTSEETLDYIKMMTLTKNVDPSVYSRLTKENIDAINKYIEAPMTATYFPNEKKGTVRNETVTAELMYYWMIALQIPVEVCEKWHVNSLIALIRVCNMKNQPPKKTSSRDLASRYSAINEANKKRLNTRG